MIPPIADVKAAAERMRCGDYDDCVEMVMQPGDRAFKGDEPKAAVELDQRRLDDESLLARFTLDVLDSPGGMSAERLAEIIAFERGATEGPWTSAFAVDDVKDNPVKTVWCDGGHFVVCGGEDWLLDCDADFIADSRQAVPELLTEALRLRAELAVVENRADPLESARPGPR